MGIDASEYVALLSTLHAQVVGVLVKRQRMATELSRSSIAQPTRVTTAPTASDHDRVAPSRRVPGPGLKTLPHTCDQRKLEPATVYRPSKHAE